MFGFFKKRIYLDYASATQVLGVAEAAQHAAESLVGNPGAIHAEGVRALKELEKARASLALELQCKPREIIFTSGLTEADNLALVGFARALERTARTLKGTHWIVSAIEHPSVLACFSEIERMGGDVTHITPSSTGRITAESVRAALQQNTVCVSVGWANSETGTVQPIREISQAIRAFEQSNRTHIFFHSDAGQAPVYLFPHVHMLGVDALSLGANKLYGPHGIGALFIADSSLLARTLFGGGQEKGLRPGTESVALACGFAAAVSEVGKRRAAESVRVKTLRDELLATLTRDIPELIVNTDMRHALPHMCNVSLPGMTGEYLTLALDMRGIAVSTKSACREGESTVSHVVGLLGTPEWRSAHTLRFSLGYGTTKSDIKRTGAALKELFKKTA